MSVANVWLERGSDRRAIMTCARKSGDRIGARAQHQPAMGQPPPLPPIAAPLDRPRPPPPPSAGLVPITDLVVATPALSSLKAAVVAAGLAGTLGGAGPFTVFAPTDDAFAAIGATAAALIQAAERGSPGELQSILLVLPNTRLPLPAGAHGPRRPPFGSTTSWPAR